MDRLLLGSRPTNLGDTMFKLFLALLVTTIFALSNELTSIDKNISLRYTLYLFDSIYNSTKAPSGVDTNITAVKEWRKSLAIPSERTLKYFGIGLNKDDLTKLKSVTQAYAISLKFEQTPTLKHHKDIDSFLYKITKANSGYLYDEETREMFKPSSWRERRIDKGWINGQIAIDKHITIHYYQIHPNIYRLITLGMAKFGLPDIAIEDVFPRKANGLAHIIKTSAYKLIDNTDINSKITINLDKLSQKYIYAKELISYRYKNHKKEITLYFKQAKHDEGDPNNRIIELILKPKSNEQRYATQARYIEEFFGLKDKVIDTSKYNDELTKASKKDLAILPKIKQIFNSKLKPNEYILLKAPFKYSEGTEWMWVLVTSWKGDKIEGILNNKPYFIKNLRSGDRVTIHQKDIFDFLYHKANGQEVGDETTKVILKYNKQ